MYSEAVISGKLLITHRTNPRHSFPMQLAMLMQQTGVWIQLTTFLAMQTRCVSMYMSSHSSLQCCLIRTMFTADFFPGMNTPAMAGKISCIVKGTLTNQSVICPTHGMKGLQVKC